MTNKEVLYIKDAIEHEDNMVSILEESINFLEDNDIIDYFKDNIKKHKSLKDKLDSLIKDGINE